MTHVGWVSNAGQPVTWKAVLEQLCNRISRCLNRPLGDALSFSAGKADQSQLSSRWSQAEIEMWLVGSGQRVRGEMTEETTGFWGLFYVGGVCALFDSCVRNIKTENEWQDTEKETWCKIAKSMFRHSEVSFHQDYMFGHDLYYCLNYKLQRLSLGFIKLGRKNWFVIQV